MRDNAATPGPPHHSNNPYISRLGNITILYGRQDAKFPFHCMVGPDWPRMLLVLLAQVFSAVLFINNIAMIWKLPVVIVASLISACTIWFYCVVAFSDPGIVFPPTSSDSNATATFHPHTELPASHSHSHFCSTYFLSSVCSACSLCSTKCSSRAYVVPDNVYESGSEFDEESRAEPTTLSSIGTSGPKLPIKKTSVISHSVPTTASVPFPTLSTSAAAATTTTTTTTTSSAIEITTGTQGVTILRMIRCEQCNINRPHTASHCYDCGVCIDQLDHHCPWTGKCIGKKTKLAFNRFMFCIALLVLFVLLLMIVTVMHGHYIFHFTEEERRKANSN